MRDYLEELPDGAGALLEELRKAERGLSGAAGAAGGAGPLSEGEADGRPDDPAVDTVSDLEYALEKRRAPEKGIGREGRRERETRTGQSSVITDRERDEADSPQALSRSYEGTGENREGREAVPLAARLEQLDRAVSSPAWTDGRSRAEASGGRADPLRRAALPGLDAGEPERARRSGPGGLSAPGEGTDWVEQADQAFRRDSRRYDGGFYLY